MISKGYAVVAAVIRSKRVLWSLIIFSLTLVRVGGAEEAAPPQMSVADEKKATINQELKELRLLRKRLYRRQKYSEREARRMFTIDKFEYRQRQNEAINYRIKVIEVDKRIAQLQEELKNLNDTHRE